MISNFEPEIRVHENELADCNGTIYYTLEDKDSVFLD